MTDEWEFDTLAVRAGQQRSQFGEHSEALYLTSSFVFDNAAQAAARFSGESRQRLRAFHQSDRHHFAGATRGARRGAGCVATASGMSAILFAGHGAVAGGRPHRRSQGVFGATQQLLGTILPRFGVNTSLSRHRPRSLSAAMTPATKLVFLETPSNPLTELIDIAALAELAQPVRHCWRSITASARRSCSDRSTSAPTSSFIRRPSFSTDRAAF